jgi:ubiquinone/menaquinone biosynthesis C-methylase UbiE
VAEVSGCRIVESDIPFEALTEARRQFADRGLGGRAVALVADGRALPLADGSFDAVVHADVFC